MALCGWLTHVVLIYTLDLRQVRSSNGKLISPGRVVSALLADLDRRVLLCDFGLTQFLTESTDVFRTFLNSYYGFMWLVSTRRSVLRQAA